jgi:hypothetical protein
MNTRVMSLLGPSLPAEVSGLGADELSGGVARRRRHVLGEELVELVEQDQVSPLDVDRVYAPYAVKPLVRIILPFRDRNRRGLVPVRTRTFK